MTVKFLPPNTKLVEPVKFDVSIYPVSALITTNGVQYATEVNDATAEYVDLFSISTHTYFPYVKGKLAWVYVNISFEAKGGTSTPVVTYKVETKNSDYAAWVTQKAATNYQTTIAYVGMRLEGYILLTAGTIDYAPFDIRLQFKTESTAADNDSTLQLKNDTVIRLVGSREVR